MCSRPRLLDSLSHTQGHNDTHNPLTLSRSTSPSSTPGHLLRPCSAYQPREHQGTLGWASCKISLCSHGRHVPRDSAGPAPAFTLILTQQWVPREGSFKHAGVVLERPSGRSAWVRRRCSTKFEQVDGGAEPTVEVDQAPESGDRIVTIRRGRQSAASPSGGGSAARPAAQRNASEAREAAARLPLESERDCERGGASDRQRVRGRLPRTPPRRSPCCSARLEIRCHSPGLPPSRSERSGQPRPARSGAPRTPSAASPHRVGKGGSVAITGSKAPFKTDKLWGNEGETFPIQSLDAVGGRAIHFDDQCSYLFFAPPV